MTKLNAKAASERDTVTDRPPIYLSPKEAVRRFSKEAQMPPSRYELSRDQFIREIRAATADKADNTTTFADLTDDNDRSQAAKKFYLVL
uniref:Uncharacterized protein n=1 Tax=Plectus sambesii TaxID=2011161 RepID=A0A914UX50_9BILA